MSQENLLTSDPASLTSDGLHHHHHSSYEKLYEDHPLDITLSSGLDLCGLTGQLEDYYTGSRRRLSPPPRPDPISNT